MFPSFLVCLQAESESEWEDDVEVNLVSSDGEDAGKTRRQWALFACLSMMRAAGGLGRAVSLHRRAQAVCACSVAVRVRVLNARPPQREKPGAHTGFPAGAEPAAAKKRLQQKKEHKGTPAAKQKAAGAAAGEPAPKVGRGGGVGERAQAAAPCSRRLPTEGSGIAPPLLVRCAWLLNSRAVCPGKPCLTPLALLLPLQRPRSAAAANGKKKLPAALQRIAGARWGAPCREM